MLFKHIKAVALLAIVVLAFLLALPVLATSYSSQLVLSNNSSMAYPMLPVVFDANNSYMAANHFMDPSGRDARVLYQSSPLPAMIADNKTLFAIASPANSSASLQYTVNNTLLSSMPIIVGQGGYITTADNASLEPSNNFTITTSGYVDTTAVGANLTSKRDVFRTHISATSNITSSIIYSTNTTYLLPDANGDYTGIIDATANHWDDVDDPVLTPDNMATYVRMTSAVQEKDAYNVDNMTAWANSVINSVTVHFRCYANTAGGGPKAQPGLLLNSIENMGTEVSIPKAWTDFSETLTKPGGGTFSLTDINNLQVVIGLRDPSSDWTHCTQIYLEINYDPILSRTIGGLSSGVHTVTASADTTNFTLIVDGTANSTALGGASVSDNSSNWIWDQGDVMPYTDNITMSVNGTPVLWYQPINIISVASLPNGASGGDYGVITWGNNPNLVSISVGPLLGAGGVALPSGPPTFAADLAPATSTTSQYPTLGTVPANLLTNPLHPFMLVMATITHFTEMQIWKEFASFLIVLVVIISLLLFQSHQLISGVVGLIGTGLAISMSIYPWWTIFVAVTYLIGTLVMEKTIYV